MSKSIYSRLRAGSGIKTTEEDYDIREDEEQHHKEEETLQLLVTAGYFRARIKGLSSFDKVIGGITWCIQGCKVDIDIDLHFKENTNVGKKIALTEKIVRVLKRMKCPHRIEPHQIQGSDFINIYPVVQWLVKLAIGRRDERMADMRRFAIGQFDKTNQWTHIVAEEAEGGQKKFDPKSTSAVIDHLDRVYQPKRKYRKPESNKSASQDIQVQSTLLEYGRRDVLIRGVDSTDTPSAKSQSSPEKAAGQEDDVKLRQEKEQVEHLMTGMSETLRDGRLAANVVSSILSMKSSEIQEAVTSYEEQSESLSQLMKGLDRLHPQQTEKMIEAFTRQLEDLQQRNEQLTEEVRVAESKAGQVRSNWEESKAKKIHVQEQIAELDTEVVGNKNLAKLEKLIALHESMKKQEQEFKSNCKQQMSDLESEINLLKEGNEQPEEDQEVVAKLDARCKKERSKLQQARLLLASQTRELNELDRQLDDIPSQWETQQYQRRFLELYEQIEATYSENKRLYDRYNTEEAVKSVLQREINLLNSIHDNFESAMSSSGGKEEFSKQMEQICGSVQQLKVNGENQRESTKAIRDQKRDELSELIDKGRNYTKLVKEFQAACSKNEQLMARAAELGIEF